MSNNNNHKMKGLLKGLRYISQIFDEEKEQEMKIGLPTDVKHVAHIGWDGPSVDSSPSWMKDFKAPGEFQSAPLNGTGDPLDKPEIKWVSEDSNRRSTRSEGESAKDRDLPDVPKSRRRASSENIVIESLGKEGSTKSRHSRKSKESSKSSRQLQQEDSSAAAAPESPSKKLPDIPKKTRRKKSKESESGGSTRPSRSKETESGGSTRSSRSKETESGGSTRSSRSKETENGGSTRSSRSKNTNDSTIALPSRTSTLADPSDLEIGSNNSKELTPPFVEELREGK